MSETQREEQEMLQTVTQERPMAIKEPFLVLIVEDEEPIANALSFIIEDAGYIPLIAMHGRQALDVLRDRYPALIITDLMMPYMNGAQLIQAVRAQHSDLPIVLMTAAGPRYSATAGADEVLPKPFNVDEIEAVLHRYLVRSSPDSPHSYAH